MQEFSALEYLKIDIANNFGLDKLLWDERISWFNENEHQLDALAAQAEDQALYYAGLQAYRKVLNNEPIGYPISLDATASGLQWLSILSGCRNTAKLCNVLDKGERMDAYTTLHEHMQISEVPRDDAKKAIMTAMYNSTATPKRIFPNEQHLAKFYETLQTEAKGAYNLNTFFQSLQDPRAEEYKWTMPNGFDVVIKVENSTQEEIKLFDDYFTLTYKKQGPTDYDRSLSPNIIHSIDALVVSELLYRCSYDQSQVKEVMKLLFSQKPVIDYYEDTTNLEMVTRLWNLYVDTNFLSARILEYLDEETITLVDPMAIFQMIESLPEKPFEILPVFDCFRVLPQYGNDIRKQYNLLMYLVSKSNLLNHICSSITGKEVNVTPISKFTKEEILNTNYALS